MNIHSQDLNDKRGPDIGAEHDRQRRHQTDQAFGREGARDQGGRGAALQKRGQADAGRKRREAVAQSFRQQPTEVRAEGTQNAAADHVQAPQQQRHAAKQVEKNHTSHDHPLRNSSRTRRLSANRARSIP
jgi:hypothetical protein